MIDKRLGHSLNEVDLRQAVVECARICYDRGLMVSNDGNISIRLNETSIMITPSGLSKGRLQEQDLVILDLSGVIQKLTSKLKPSTETPMHLEVYKKRPDVHAAIHAHPVFATSLSVAGLEFPNNILPEVLLTLGEVPTTKYATPSSEEDALAVRDLIRDHDAILLCQHGSLTVGKDLEDALNHLERIEHVAEVFWRARALGKVSRIPTREQKRLSEMRATIFFSGK
ncbi:MAG: hypothetical protein A2Y54_04460 [Chloroflexi bacterium RBG_16_51_16]|nr:MAG: hypothetical protein A2Y54_04460 [Chloroflexi bacterium RBG_16_51_16]